jgi:hypothetical protein
MQPGPPPAPPPPPQPYVPPPPGQPPRAGWGRFWIGVLTGGCAVLALEAVAALVFALVLGAAINGVVRQGSGGGGVLPGGLPGGLPLPSGLPRLSQSSDPCSPAPCVAHGGVTVLVASVDRGAGAASDPREHLVRVRVSFIATSGTHTVTPESVAIRDSTGGMTLAGVDQAAAACGDDATTSTDLTAGQRAGPYTLCYAVGGAASAPLTLVWIDPEDLSVVELKLP